MRIDTWNVRSLYRSGSFTTVARELVRYTLGLAGMQEDRWDIRGTERAGNCIFSMENIKIISKEQKFL
jgi:hypothetical protein